MLRLQAQATEQVAEQVVDAAKAAGRLLAENLRGRSVTVRWTLLYKEHSVCQVLELGCGTGLVAIAALIGLLGSS